MLAFMAGVVNSINLNSGRSQQRTPNIPMRVAGGNSTIDQAQVVFVGTNNHYDPNFQGAISATLNVLPQPGDVVLTEGEPYGGALKGSWIPEMAGVDTGEVTLRGWEDAGLYERATGIVRELSQDIQTLNILSGMSLGQLIKPVIEDLKQKISSGLATIDKVVLHERTRAMKAAVMSVLGNGLHEGRTVFVYAGAAHLTSSELGGMNSIKHVILEV